ncbi:OmpA family protein [Microbacterium sp. NPDC089189]|uniref:OmpA family protein n=1 Tax=Microbacterium sp. NPDC089189 TaxID=3154972 RepID=UPI00343CCF25
MTKSPRSAARSAAVLALAAIVLAGCAPEPAPVSSTPAASAPAPTATSTLPAVAGYAPGDVPPVPLFTMPDLSLLDESLGGFAITLDREIAPRPGLDIRPAACGDVRERAAGRGTALLYGDGSGSFSGPDGEIRNYGDGSGTFTVGGVTATVYGDGSGSYTSPDAQIWNYGDGSGQVTTSEGETWVYGDGSASLKTDTVEHWNYGDGSALYRDPEVEIHNYGDGSGSYTTAGLEIWNYGDGTGAVNGVPTQVEPLAPEAPVGVFPPLGTLAPLTSCGTTITLQDGVLFDFDKADVRSDAAAVLDELASVMAELGVPAAEIGGHTDAIGTDSYNQTLSERRAQAVVAALTERGVDADLSAVGYGETAPVAPNEIDGADNAPGRQLNRRVEIFIPAF